MKKKILTGLILVLLFIQVFRPERNIHSGDQANDISRIYPVSDSVAKLLQIACNDCHSNNTVYPWYAQVQPVAWWLNHHVEEGKHELNFNEFASYPARKQYHKMEELEEQVKEGEMPLNSYTWIHKEARLNESQKHLLIIWAESVIDSLEARYPIDSLKKRKQ